jgi:hypothetical protein
LISSDLPVAADFFADTLQPYSVLRLKVEATESIDELIARQKPRESMAVIPAWE